MNIENIFKRVIILDFLLLMLSFLLEIFIPSYVIDENASITNIEIILLVFPLVYSYNLYLLYNFKSLGKILYFPLFCFSLGIGFALPLEFLNIPTTHFMFFIDSIAVTLTGVILTFIYYTDIKI